jgi:hypothetical protein
MLYCGELRVGRGGIEGGREKAEVEVEKAGRLFITLVLK